MSYKGKYADCVSGRSILAAFRVLSVRVFREETFTDRSRHQDCISFECLVHHVCEEYEALIKLREKISAFLCVDAVTKRVAYLWVSLSVCVCVCLCVCTRIHYVYKCLREDLQDVGLTEHQSVCEGQTEGGAMLMLTGECVFCM